MGKLLIKTGVWIASSKAEIAIGSVVTHTVSYDSSGEGGQGHAGRGDCD